MAAWGVGIFDDDLARSVREDFERDVAGGASVFEAAKRVMARHAAANSAVVYMALAALQLEHGVIQPRIRKLALTAIISGEAAEPWANGDPGALAARQRELQNLRDRLNEKLD